MATFTGSDALTLEPIYNHTGIVAMQYKGVFSAATLSDIFLIGRVPRGALLTGVSGTIGTSNADSAIKLGIRGPQGSANNIGDEIAFGTHTASSTANPVAISESLAKAIVVSFTDSIYAEGPYAMVYATGNTGSFSDTFSVDLVIQYTMNHRGNTTN